MSWKGNTKEQVVPAIRESGIYSLHKLSALQANSYGENMQTKIKWIFAGQILAIVMIIALLAGPSVLNANNDQTELQPSEFAVIYKQAVTSPLNKAVSKVKDTEIARFSQKLIQAYELDDVASNNGMDDASGMANLLPDVENIHRKAMDMPLIEAGKQIKDKELADFYKSFISNIGVEQ
jgi:hypothetical protein